MERFFGIAVYALGLIMVVTMIMNAMGVIERPGPIAALAFTLFGYLLCVTGYLFSRRSEPDY